MPRSPRPTLALAAAAAVAAAIAAPLPAAAEYLARNGLVVHPEADGSFTIPWRGLSGAPAFWCAAADYALVALDSPRTQRIRRLTPVPRDGGAPMRFALGPGPSAGDTGLALLTPDDGTLSLHFALELCDSSAT
jgi:hypothetical protein